MVILKTGLWEIKAKIHDLLFKIPPFKNVKNDEKDIFIDLYSNVKEIINGKIVDIGCGTGEFAKLFPEKNSIFGIDITAKMLTKSANKMPNASFIRADAQHLPLKDSSLDFVSMIGLTEYFKDQSKPLLEVKRVLKKQGRSIISFSKPSILHLPRRFWNIKFYTKNKAEINELFELSGLKVIKKKDGYMQTQVLCEKTL